MSREIDLAIIIVAYNARGLLDECLASLFLHAQGIDFDVFVVDNASRDGSAELMEEKYPQAILIRNPVNLYFTKANNQAIQQSRGRYVLLLNPDTVVQSDAIQQMVKFMDAHPDAAACTPKLLNPDGSLQPSCMKIPTRLYGVCQALLLNNLLPNNPVNRNIQYADWDRHDIREVEVGGGACLMVRRKAIQAVGLLDEGFKMYYEETDWCWRLRQAGWKIYYLPDARIIHHLAGTSRGHPHMRRINHQSFLLFYRKHYGIVAFGLLWVLTLIPNLVILPVIDLLRGLIGRGRQ